MIKSLISTVPRRWCGVGKQTFAVSCVALMVALAGAPASAQTAQSYTTAGAAYTQNFDSLLSSAAGTTPSTPTSGATTVDLGQGFAFRESLTNANNAYTTGTGSSTAGDTYSFGAATGNSERALGELRSGSLSTVIGAAFTNNTGVTLTVFNIKYDAELWRIGTTNHTTPDGLTFEYSVDQAATINSGTYTAVSALNYTAPLGTAGALNGNSNSTTKTAQITGLSLANGQTIRFRWTDIDANSSDDGIGIDNFAFTGAASTAVELMQFKPLAVSGGVWLRWKTGMEENNVGFNVYRQTKTDGIWGAKVKLNPSLIASATLLPIPSVDSSDGGYVYGWPDKNPGDLLKVRYWLEDIDTSGKKTLHGPATPVPGSGSISTRVKSPLLSEISSSP
jgi:hypothetical protein